MLEILIKLLFLCLPFQIALNPAKGFDLASVRIIIPLIFLAWIISSLKNKKIIIPSSLNFLLLISFLFIAAFSILFADNPNWGLRKLAFLLSIFPLFFVIYDQFSSEEDKIISLLKYSVWGAFLASGVGIIQFLLQFVFPLDKLYSFWAIIITPFLGESFSQAVLTNPSWLVNVSGHTLLRSTAFFPDPHMFSFYLNITGLISLGIYFYYKNKLRNKSLGQKYLFFFLLITLCSVLTFSRGGYLGLISGLILFSIFSLKTRLKYIFNNAKNILILISLTIFLLLITLTSNPFSKRLSSSFNLNEGSNIGRLQTWNQSLNVIRENFIRGVGLGNYSLAIKPSADYREPIYSHNTYLDIASETGIVNALIWITVILVTVISFLKIFILKNNFIYLGLASSIFSFFIHSFFETALFSVHVFTIIIMILSIHNFKKDA